MSRHADDVRAAVEAGSAVASAIVASWQRSANLHGLDPDSAVGPCPDMVLLRESRALNAAMVAAADPHLDQLFGALQEAEGIVLLADRDGVAISLRSGRSHATSERRTAHWLGSSVSEQRIGTNGTGTCLAEERPAVVRGDDHFLASLTPTACYAAPIFAPDGTLAGCINVLSMRHAGPDSAFEAFVRMAVGAAARSVEIEMFASAFPRAKLMLAPRYGRHQGAVLAVDRDDVIVGATRRARQMLELADADIARGIDLDALSGLPTATRLAETERRLIARVLARNGGNVSAAAKEIGISRSTLYRKLQAPALS